MISSSVLTADDMKYLKSLLPYKQLRLIYRLSQEDDKSAKTFHERCDNKGPTILVLKTETGRRIGGYTKLSWWRPDDCVKKYYFVQDRAAFLIAFDSKTKI